MKVEGKQLKVRLPDELKAWIDRQSYENRSSKGSEIVRAVRERKDRVEARARKTELQA